MSGTYKVRRGIRFGSVRLWGGRFYACRLPSLGEYHVRVVIRGRPVSLRLKTRSDEGGG